MAQKMDIVELFEKIEAFKAADPRSVSQDVHARVTLYIDVSKIIRDAGWGPWEYEATLCMATPC